MKKRLIAVPALAAALAVTGGLGGGTALAAAPSISPSVNAVVTGTVNVGSGPGSCASNYTNNASFSGIQIVGLFVDSQGSAVLANPVNAANIDACISSVVSLAGNPIVSGGTLLPSLYSTTSGYHGAGLIGSVLGGEFVTAGAVAVPEIDLQFCVAGGTAVPPPLGGAGATCNSTSLASFGVTHALGVLVATPPATQVGVQSEVAGPIVGGSELEN